VISLRKYNSFGIDAFAADMLELNNISQAQEFFKTNNLKHKNHLILGGGSNILLTKNFDGLILKNNILGKKIINDDPDHVILEVGAGENWHEFVLYCIENNYAGLENLSLIPGNVGASPMQNIGAYGVEVKDLIVAVEAIEIKSGEIVNFSNEECKFEYRSSIFKTSHKNRFIITTVQFKLSKNPTFKIEYGAIRSELENRGISEENLSIKAISEAVIAIRQSKLPDPNEIGNAGSFFKNPIVTEEQKNTLLNVYADMPFYTIGDNNFKLAAGWLIEKAGWKGFREKDFGVHQKQALVLVNYGKADGADIYNLSERILQSVKQKFGVTLEREVNII